MTDFKSLRIVHEYTQTNPASPEKVFPLLCPVREAEWVPEWQYRLICSDSGVAELGCIFTTPNAKAPTKTSDGQTANNQNATGAETTSGQTAKNQNSTAAETTWITVDYDPAAFRIAYVWINPGLVAAELRIQLESASNGTTRSHIRYRYTGLSPEGNREVERYDEKWFTQKMHGWEFAINHYLSTGRKIEAGAWQ